MKAQLQRGRKVYPIEFHAIQYVCKDPGTFLHPRSIFLSYESLWTRGDLSQDLSGSKTCMTLNISTSSSKSIFWIQKISIMLRCQYSV